MYRIFKPSLQHVSLQTEKIILGTRYIATKVPEKIVTHCDDDSLHVTWGKDNSSYSYLWLRDNCSCLQCIHPFNQQKLHSSADIPLDIKPKKFEIINEKTAEITWNRPLRHGNDLNHISHYSFDFLQRYKSIKNSEKFRYNDIKPTTWNKDEYKLDWISYGEYMNTDQGLHKVVQRLYNQGLVFLRDVPTVDNAVTDVAERIGHVQETFYGRDFDVKNIAKSTNIAYTSLYLGFHMDLMYLDSPPGIQLLHSMKNSVTGGASIFVDSFRAVELLKENYPDDYQVLKSTPVTFHYLNDGHHMYYKRYTIVDDESHSGSAWNSHVNYAPQFQGPLDSLTPAQSKRFYKAFQRFADLIEDGALRYQLTLHPGELVLFANRRVLHGRTAFDPNSGDRHLKGTYLTLDSLKDKLRVLCEEYGYDSKV